MELPPKIGQLLIEDRPRDAVHIAVIPVVAAAVELAPGAPVVLTTDGQATSGPMEKAVGVVDPFLHRNVKRDERFWLFLKPGTIIGLRHHWWHPAFPDAASSSPEDVKATSAAWIEAFALRELGIDYGRLMDAADQHVYSDGDEYTMDNTERYKNVAEATWDEFWRHYTVVTGRTPPKVAWAPFTCSC